MTDGYLNIPQIFGGGHATASGPRRKPGPEIDVVR
jgi:hypothetical protein